MESEPMLTPRENSLYRMFKGGSNPRHCITQDSKHNTLPIELFRPPSGTRLRGKRRVDGGWIKEVSKGGYYGFVEKEGLCTGGGIGGGGGGEGGMCFCVLGLSECLNLTYPFLFVSVSISSSVCLCLWLSVCLSPLPPSPLPHPF